MPQPANARIIRPNMPSYGITPQQTDQMLTWDWIDEQMGKSRNYWICTTRPDGHPHAVPVWGVWLDDALYFGTGRTSVKAKNIRHQNVVVVHLESGDDTLIIEGKLVELSHTDERKPKIFKTYADKYPPFNPADNDSSDDTLWVQLVPSKIKAWLETDFNASATYWVFDDV